MLAIGGLLAGGALLVIVILTPIFRRPTPPRWVTWPLAGELVTVAIVSVLALGVGCVGVGAIQVWQQGLDLVQIGLFAASIAAVVVARRWLKARTTVPVELTAGPPGIRPLQPGIARPANQPGAPSPPKRPRRAA